MAKNSNNNTATRSKSRQKRKAKSAAKKKKLLKKKNRKHVGAKRVLAVLGILIVAGIVTVAFILHDAQKINYDNIYANLAESSILYDKNGKKIDSIYSGEGSRVIVDYEDMPEDLVNAFVAIEDKTFWDHHGFNFIRMAGALKDALFKDGRVGGTSTITQQLARNLYLSESKTERSLTRKIKEAYYSIQLERHLSKKEIIEAYMNTIPLGQNSLGVQAASEAYFSKSVKKLKLLECAALASLPQAPSAYSYIKTVAKGEVSDDDSSIIKQGNLNTYMYNGEAEWRVNLVLDNMLDQGYIDSERRGKVKVSKLKKKIKPNLDDETYEAQFFVDYAITNLTEDLMEEYNLSESEATHMVYSGGLRIHTTLDKEMQNAIEDQFKENYNFPGVTGLNTDENGNIIGKGGSITLYNYNTYFNDDSSFVINDDEFVIKNNGDVVLKKGKRLNFYEVESGDKKEINIEFKNIYFREEGVFYSINGGVINIPPEYKSINDKGNLVIDAKFLNTKKKFMNVNEDEITIPNTSYSLRQQVQQPQSSMVILEHDNGQIKAMVGGRNIEGKMNYNRTTSPRQPGSSIKPIGAYGPALEMGAEKQQIQDGERSFGTYWTAGSVIKDEEMKTNGRVWPNNWYSKYRGSRTLRYCVEQSINTTAVKVLNNIGTERSVDFLKKLGITTVVEDGDGDVNDLNPAALALGGMTKGISPLQMASAYGAFPNQGVHVEPTAYTEVRSNDDELILKSKPKKTIAMDKGVAFIMTDILRTTVTNGIANPASISNAPVAGKTGTTSDNFDAWFVGTTPKYSAAVWIGNDVNIQLSEGSKAAAILWSRVMSNAIEGEDSGSFPEAPDNVSKQTISGLSDYYIDGTAPSSISITYDHKPDRKSKSSEDSEDEEGEGDEKEDGKKSDKKGDKEKNDEAENEDQAGDGDGDGDGEPPSATPSSIGTSYIKQINFSNNELYNLCMLYYEYIALGNTPYYLRVS